MSATQWVNQDWLCEFHKRIHFQFQNTFQKCLNIVLCAGSGGDKLTQWLLIDTACGMFGAGEASSVCFCKRLSCNPVLSMVSSGPQKDSSYSLQVQFNLLYSPLLLCLHQCATQLLESICSIASQSQELFLQGAVSLTCSDRLTLNSEGMLSVCSSTQMFVSPEAIVFLFSKHS